MLSLKLYNLWERIKYDVRQESILRPVLFNILLCDLFLLIHNVDVPRYALHNTHTENVQIRFWKNLNVHPETYLNGSFITQ